MSDNTNLNINKDSCNADETSNLANVNNNELKPKKTRKRKYWDLDQDALLDRLAKKYDYNWKNISCFFIKKTSSELERRWHQRFDNSIKKGNWSLEEDHIIQLKYNEFGGDWKLISKFIPGRLPSMIKNRFYKKIYKNIQNEKQSMNSYVDFGSLDIIQGKPIDNDFLDSFLDLSEEVTSDTQNESASSVDFKMTTIESDSSEKAQILEILQKKLQDIQQHLNIAKQTLLHYQNVGE